MQYRLGRSPTLTYGQFFGASERRREISGFSLSRMTPVLPPEDVPLHTHDHATFVLLLGGTYVSSAANAGFECEAPCLIYNPPGTTHRDRFKSTAGQFLAISISPERFRAICDFAALPVTAICVRSRDVLIPGRRIAHELDRWEPTSALLAEGACLELLAGVAHRIAAPTRTPPRWLDWAKDYLRDHSADHVRIADVAQAIGVHPVYFARMFRKHLHCTPGEYVTRCRTQKAADLLANSRLTLAQMALQSGFTDQSHFSKMFKRGFGVTPGKYRRLLTRDPV